MPEIMIDSISREDGAALRAQILHPDAQKIASGAAQYEDTDAIHLGAYSNGLLAAVVSFTPYNEDGIKARDVYHLRGAATLAEVRGRGIGAALISAGIEKCRQRNVSRIWCNGRSAARSFYERLGFRPIGEEFVTTTGPHYRFALDL